MATRNRQHSTHPQNDEVFTPIRTLAQSDFAVLVGTLVWAKHSHWPWWPGLVVNNNDVGWPALKKKGTYCILWLGPNKSASVLPADKLSDLMDPNLTRLMNQPIKEEGQEQEKATLEALRGLLSKQILDENELDSIPVRKLKSLAVQTRIEAEFICGRKQVVVDKTSFWFKRTIDSLKSTNESLTNASNKKRTTRLPLAINLQKKVITSPSDSYKEGSPSSSSSTPSAEMFPPAINYSTIERSTKKTEEEGDEPPPRKKIALGLHKQPSDQGAATKPEKGGVSLVMQTFPKDKLSRSLELPKLNEEEKTQASDGDVDFRTDLAVDEQKVQDVKEDLKHHKVVLDAVLKSELQSVGPIDRPKPAAGGSKRLVSETDVPILIKYLDGSHSMESTVNEFIRHLERTRLQDKNVPSKVRIKDKIREIGTWNKKTSTWMVPPEGSTPILLDTSTEKEMYLHPNGVSSLQANTGTDAATSSHPETSSSIKPQLHELPSPWTLTASSLTSFSCYPLSDWEISDYSSGEGSNEGKENISSGRSKVALVEEAKIAPGKKLFVSLDAQMNLVKQVLEEKVSESSNVSLETKKNQRKMKSKAVRKNQEEVKLTKKKKKFMYVKLDAQMELVAQVLAEKVREAKAVPAKKKMKK